MAELEEIDAWHERVGRKELMGDSAPGSLYLLRWIREGPWGEAAQHVIWQFMYFYLFLLIGFGFLYLMIRSTSQLREIRRNVAEAIRAEQARKFDIDDYRNMAYGGIA